MSNYSTAIILLLQDNYHLNQPGGNVTVANNLFMSSGDPVHGTRLIYLAGGYDVRIYHNTVFGNSNTIVISDSPTTGVVFRDNIATTGQYVMSCPVDGQPNTCWPSMLMTKNVLIDTRSDQTYPLSLIFPGN